MANEDIALVARLAHIVTVVLMAAPYYNLAIVAGRVRFGKAPIAVDRYFESLIRGNAVRCFVFLATALATGLLLLWAQDDLGTLATERILQAKLALLALLGLSLCVVHFGVQPKIDGILAASPGEVVAADRIDELKRLRLVRRRMAGLCLFVVLTTILAAVQLRVVWPVPLFAAAEAVAAIIAFAAYRRGSPFGWA